MNNFWKSYLDYIESKTLAEKLSLESFEKMKQDFNNMNSNSALRKVFDSYLKILKQGENFEVEKEILFAKIAYQEKRNLFPNGFTKFLRKIYEDLQNDKNKFKQFLEVFVAYHKFFNPKAK